MDAANQSTVSETPHGLRFSLRHLFVAVTLTAVAIVTLLNANWWLVCILVTVQYCWLAVAMLNSIFSTRSARPYWIGFALIGMIYACLLGGTFTHINFGASESIEVDASPFVSGQLLAGIYNRMRSARAADIVSYAPPPSTLPARDVGFGTTPSPGLPPQAEMTSAPPLSASDSPVSSVAPAVPSTVGFTPSLPPSVNTAVNTASVPSSLHFFGVGNAWFSMLFAHLAGWLAMWIDARARRNSAGVVA